MKEIERKSISVQVSMRFEFKQGFKLSGGDFIKNCQKKWFVVLQILRANQYHFSELEF